MSMQRSPNSGKYDEQKSTDYSNTYLNQLMKSSRS